MKVVFDEFLIGESAVLTLDDTIDFSEPLILDLWGFEKAAVIIDFKEAELHEINIKNLRIITHNYFLSFWDYAKNLSLLIKK